MIGFPAFLRRVIRYRRDNGLPDLNFGNQSYVLTGGGWKKSEEEAISREDFIQAVESALGIPAANQRDGYGLVELACRTWNVGITASTCRTLPGRSPATSRPSPPCPMAKPGSST